MNKNILTAGLAAIFAVFFSLNTSAADETSTVCLDEFTGLQEEYFNFSGQFTVVSSEPGNLSPYQLLKVRQNGLSYALWEHLNGESRGYALRDGQGFDFNQARAAVSGLNWHPTLIWDRLLAKDSRIRDYVCVFTGRSRVAGHKVSLLRLTPQDGLRYGYVIAKDDDSKLPVEISVVDPEDGVVSQIMVLGVAQSDNVHFPMDDKWFDRLSQEKSLNGAVPWPELMIPNVFELIDNGQMLIGSDQVAFQEYFDGLNSFRVYRAPKTSVMLPALNNGPLSVLRKPAPTHEYAVVGEIPVRLAEQILSKITAVP